MTRQHNHREAVPCQGSADALQTHNGYMYQRLYDSDGQHAHSPPVLGAVESDEAGVSSTMEFVPMVYTYPVHPEIRQDRPGACPKCNTALGPTMSVVEEEENVEFAGFRRRFWASSPLAAVVFVLAMAGHQLTRPDPAWQDRPKSALATPVVLQTGLPFFRRCAQSFVYHSPNMWTLIGLSTGAVYLYSAVAVVAPGMFPSTFVASGRVRAYLEAAAVIISLTLLGQMPEPKARSQTSIAVRSLLGPTLKTAKRINIDDSEEDVPIAHVHMGDLLRVRPDEEVPVDGAAAAGASASDELIAIGEPILVSKRAGDHVIGATMNTSGTLAVRSEKVGAQTVPSQIVQIVTQAQHSKAPVQQMADKVADVLMIGVVGIVVMTLFAWGIWGPQPSWAHGLINAVVVLVIACLCAPGLVAPISIMVANGKGAEHGILSRGIAAIEGLRKVDTLIVDKTGTLTEGHLSLDRAIGFNGSSSMDALRLAAGLDQGSEHPLVVAIIAQVHEQGLALERSEDLESVLGIGVRKYVAGRGLAPGNTPLIQAHAVVVNVASTRADAMRAQSASVMYLAVNGVFAGLLSVSDRVKTTTPQTLTQFRTDGLQIVMAIGDGDMTAQPVVRQLGIIEFHGEVRPTDRLALVATLQKRGLIVAMAGDSINDASALAKIDVGITMGAGTDVMMSSIQVTLVKGDLWGIACARTLSKATIVNTKRNLGFAFLYNALSAPLAASVLHLFTGLLLSPMIVTLAMSLSLVSVVANAPRLCATRL